MCDFWASGLRLARTAAEFKPSMGSGVLRALGIRKGCVGLRLQSLDSNLNGVVGLTVTASGIPDGGEGSGGEGGGDGERLGDVLRV